LVDKWSGKGETRNKKKRKWKKRVHRAGRKTEKSKEAEQGPNRARRKRMAMHRRRVGPGNDRKEINKTQETRGN